MKRVILFISLLFPLYLMSQVTEIGKTVEYNGKNPKTVLSGVTIIAGTASDVSSKSGEFALRFQTLKKGDRVSYNRIAKNGYVIFNKDALDSWIISGSENPFVIVLCKASEFDRLIALHYDVSFNSYKSQYEKEQIKTRKLKEEGKLKEVEYESRLKEIQDRYDLALANLSEQSEIMARIDESKLDEVTQKALDLTKSGKIDEAVVILRKRNSLGLLERQIKKKKMAEDNITKIIDDIKNGEINIYIAQGGKENLDYCCKIYTTIALDDTTNFNNVYDCAKFLKGQNRHKEAERYYNIALAIAPDSESKALCQNNLGVIYQDTQRYDLAESMFNSALEIYNKLAKNGYEKYSLSIIKTQNNLGVLYQDTQRYDLAERMYKSALTIFKQLAEKNPDVYSKNIAKNQNNLGSLYQETQRYDLAESMYKSSMDIYQQLAENKPDMHNSDLAHTQNYLGHLYQETQRYDSAESLYKSSLEIFQRLSEKNPDVYSKNEANIQNNLGTFYSAKQQYDLAEKYLKSALSLYNELAIISPETYLQDVAMAQNNLATIYGDTQRYDLAENMYKATIENYTKLCKNNQEVYSRFVASAQNNLGYFYYSTQRYDLAENLFNLALNTYNQLAEKNPDVYTPDVARVKLNLGHLYREAQRYELAEKMFNSALEIYKQLAEKNPEVFSENITGVQNNLGALYYDTKRYDLAMKFFSAAYKYDDKGQLIWKDLVTGTPVEGGVAYNKGLKGVYFILEFCSWNIYDPIYPMSGVIMQNANNTRHIVFMDENLNIIEESFEPGKIGIQFSSYTPPADSKMVQIILQKYEQWKSQKINK